MAAIDSASSMITPKDFYTVVFAKEPEVQNPISMTWDSQGRLWVAENFTYAERAIQFDRSLRDRVLIFEDTDGDGVADKRRVFTDSVQMLGGIEVGLGGVWLICPPKLLFIPDADGDGVPDGPAQTALDGFDLSTQNYHTFANGLRFGPDGWLYGRCGSSSPGKIANPGTPEDERIRLEGGMWRYHPTRKTVEALTTGTTNPWGHDWNAEGELFFVNTVNGHLWHMIPGAHFARGNSLDPNPSTYELIDTHADHYHFDTGQNWTASRDGAASSYGGGHAHCGAMIYQETRWPEAYRNRLFTLNFHGRRVNQEFLQRAGSGYVASHLPDFLMCQDPFFRGMEIAAGPDGNVFVLDWSDTGECHEATGVHRTSGRIFKVSFGEASTVAPLINLRTISESELVAYVIGDRAWFRRQAVLELQRRKMMNALSPATVVELQNAVSQSRGPLAAHAMMALVACDSMNPEFARAMFSHQEESVRCWAVRALTDGCPLDDAYGPRNTVPHFDPSLLADLSILASTDSSGLVRLAIASVIQRLPVVDRPQLAMALVQRAEDAEDHNLPLLVWYGLIPVAKENPLALIDVALVSKWPKTQRFIARRLGEGIALSPDGTNLLLQRASDSGSMQTKLAVLEGLADSLKGWRKATKPAAWNLFVDSLHDHQDQSTLNLVRELSVVFGEGRAMSEVRQLLLNDKNDITVRRSALQALVNQRPDDLKEICMKLISDSKLNAIAAQGLSLSDDPESAQALVRAYPKFRSRNRPELISILTQRVSSAFALLDGIELGKIPKGDLTPYDARQILSLGDESLRQRLVDVWGELRESPAERQELMAALKKMLESPHDLPPNLSEGRLIFQNLCGKCHKLYGVGETIGPDLTGSGRNNLDYLIENIVDPSAVVGVDYRVSTILLEDGRLISGVIVSRNESTLMIQTQTEKLVIPLVDVDTVQQTTQSPMPEGQLNQLTEEQIRNFFAYLQHPYQVDMPK